MKLTINNPNCGLYNVYLDGKGPLRYIIEANEEEGYISGYEEKEDGSGVVIKNGNPVKYRKEGKVELKRG